MNTVLLRSVALIALTTACSPATTHPVGSAGASAAPSVRRFTVHGRVRSIPPSREFVSIAHEDIPGYMQAMTMDFEPSRQGQLDPLHVGDPVTFVFVEAADHRLVLESIEVVAGTGH